MADHEFRIETDSPAKDDLMFWRIVGHEALARPSTYELTVLSENRAIDATDILGRAFDLVVEFEDKDGGKHERHCQGHAVRFVRAGHVGRHFEYRITLRSWFWLLNKRINSRILQDKKVLEVLDAVFEDSPIKRFKKTKTGNVIGTHNPRRYCVQHQESDYQFLSRLIEDEGIYYWFDAHDAPGTMHLSDASDLAHEKLPVAATLRYVLGGASEARHEEIWHWTHARQFDTGKQASRDSDFKAIRKKLGAAIDASDSHELADFEAFEFPGGYFKGDEAENRTKLRGEELNARRDRHWALTGWPDVAAGRSFKFEGDPDGTRDGDYLIAACTFMLSHPGYESASADATAPRKLYTALAEALKDDAVNADTLQELENLIAETPMLEGSQPGTSVFLITAIPLERSYRPPRLTPRVTMPGPQTAIVVGPAGDELHVDDHGRVKVHFHWDRYDESNEKSTCWVRVSQPWGGKGWGGYFIPRIGQEVIVDFLNGDPDRPVIVGRVYNDDQPIPYKSPTQSGFRTRSTPGGGANNYNEIMFEDKKGEENITIHAERNMSRSVELDDSTSVDRDQTVTVKRDQTSTVVRDRKTTVENNDTTIIQQFQKLTVGKNQDNHVVGYQTTNVDIDHALLVKGHHKIHADGNRTDSTGGNETRSVTGTQTITVKGGVKYKAPTMLFEAGHIEFKVTGGNSMKIDANAAPYAAAFQKYTLVSNTELNMVAIGNINTVSVGSNTTVLGPNTSGYIGNNTDFNLGVARSTFMGLSMENALGVAMSNFLGLKIENTLAVTMESTAGLKIERDGTSVRQAPLHSIMPGAGAGAGTDATAAMANAGTVGAVAGLGYGIVSMLSGAASLGSQYGDARKMLNEILSSPDVDKIPGMRGRLERMRNLVGTNVSDGLALILTGGAAGPVLGLLGMVPGVDAVGSERGANELLERDDSGNPKN
ncbi:MULTISPECIES: type VI secretion system Vgr family protein [unclassified Variovorax]|jgi:type VI secretion system secreted protein VgrG|uniref:type VI secretion system Vgr family protein n=1 Tax=Variovorax TaxID=34072 RepID=UPI0009ECB2FE|nr:MULTISPECIES: type VI secretion system tip protein TssI/VgrG [unclassified Variovorax]MBS79494.1 type VI secretion system tip protein VgrG [Variovorax sp.]MCT8180626.1 type VI secretion system tip protein VgrG [Variovorax sp. CY25R-8]